MLKKVVKITQEKEEKISKREIRKKINQIKYLASQKKLSKNTLRREILKLEKLLQGVFLLEKKLKEKENRQSQEIASLKRQIKELRQRLSMANDFALRKKVTSLSHLVGELLAQRTIKKEIEREKEKRKVKKGLREDKGERTLKLSPEERLKRLQEKISSLKEKGVLPPEEILSLEQRINELRKKLLEKTASSEEPVKHELLFNSQQEEPQKRDKEKEIVLPPPPKKIC